MPSRGVVPGDIFRANDAWNDIIDAMASGSGGVDVDIPDARPPVLEADLVRAAHASLWNEEEAIEVFGDLVANYTGCVAGSIRDILLSMVAHAGAIAILTERQRWDGEGGGLSVREARLEAAVHGVIDGLDMAMADVAPGTWPVLETLKRDLGAALRG